MPQTGTKLWLKSIVANGDGETNTVTFVVYRPRFGESLDFHFQVKRSGSLDGDMQTGLEQFRELVAEMQLALSESLQDRSAPLR